jgi:hypothetical protein
MAWPLLVCMSCSLPPSSMSECRRFAGDDERGGGRAGSWSDWWSALVEAASVGSRLSRVMLA